MSFSTGKIPKYRKHASGQARVTINGRDFYLGPYGTAVSKREYDRLITEFLSSGRSGSFGLQDAAYTVAMMLADYLRFARDYYGTGKTSELHRIKLAARPLKRLYAETHATEFDPQRFKVVRQAMIDDGLSRQGTNARMKRLVRMFKWAASEGKLPASVFQTLKLIPSLKRGRTAAPDTEPVTPVEKSVVDATLQKLSPIVADMVRIQLLIGCRPGEVCTLTPGCIDRSSDVWEAIICEHKTEHHGHKRTLYIGPQAQAILSPYLDRADDTYLFRPCDAVAIRRQRDAAIRTTPLSCGNRPGKRSGGLKGKNSRKTAGTQYTTNSYRRAIHNACDKAFIPPSPLAQQPDESDAARKRRLNDSLLKALAEWQSDHRWSPNQLRHSRGTDVRKRFGLEAAQVILGHKKADVTQIYAERDREKAIEVSRQAG